MTDLFLPAIRLSRGADPATSKLAGAAMVKHLSKLQRIVYDHFRDAGEEGLTDLQLERRTGNHLSTFRTRRAELVKAGLIKDSGRTKHQQGRKRIVWIRVRL